MPDPTLQSTALRYAASDLTPEEIAAFEMRLAEDQTARDALAEAVRLSAAAIGQRSPAPHPSFRAQIRARLGLGYRGHPVAWVGLGAVAVAVCALFAVSLADRDAAPEAATAAPAAPAEGSAPHPEPAIPPLPEAIVAVENPSGACSEERSVAEIWADLSNHDSMEKARDDELRWRQRVRDLVSPHHISATAKGTDGP